MSGKNEKLEVEEVKMENLTFLNQWHIQDFKKGGHIFAGH